MARVSILVGLPLLFSVFGELAWKKYIFNNLKNIPVSTLSLRLLVLVT